MTRRLTVSATMFMVLTFGFFATPLQASGTPTDLGASPKSLHFGAVPVGTSSDTKQITLTNNTGTLLALGGPGTTDPTDYSATGGSPNPCGTTLGSGTQCEVGVVFNPASTGQHPAHFEIAYKIAACSTDPTCWSTLSVGLHGRGT